MNAMCGLTDGVIGVQLSPFYDLPSQEAQGICRHQHV